MKSIYQVRTALVIKNKNRMKYKNQIPSSIVRLRIFHITSILVISGLMNVLIL